MTVMNNTEHLFVYGTLMPGEINHHYLQSIDGCWERAFVKGHLYPEGIGLAQGYPVLVLDEAAVNVSGWLFTSMAMHEHWSILDDFEGFAYRRVKAHVHTENKQWLEAFVYVLAENIVMGTSKNGLFL